MGYFVNRIRMFFQKELNGIGTIEMILILCVLIAMVIVFKTQLTTLISNIFNSINTSAKKIY